MIIWFEHISNPLKSVIGSIILTKERYRSIKLIRTENSREQISCTLCTNSVLFTALNKDTKAGDNNHGLLINLAKHIVWKDYKDYRKSPFQDLNFWENCPRQCLLYLYWLYGPRLTSCTWGRAMKCSLHIQIDKHGANQRLLYLDISTFI